MVTNAQITNAGTDSEPYPVAQVTFMGNLQDVQKILPYPLVGNPLDNASMVLLHVNDSEEHKFGIAYEPKRRLKAFQKGEGGIHNILTGNYVVMLNDGSTEVYTMTDLVEKITQDVKATIGRDINAIIGRDIAASIGRDINIDVTRDILATLGRDLTLDVARNIIASFVDATLNGTTLTIGADIALTGNVTMTGDMTITGNVSNTGTLHNNGVNVGSTHVHGGVTSGPSNTAVPH